MNGSTSNGIGSTIYSELHDVPISFDAVDERLYLGNLTLACDDKTLEKLNITHILTVDSVPLPRAILDKTHFKFKYVQMADVPKQDLLGHLKATNKFISNAVDTGGTVLVHCYFGVSRSAAVVIAYLMWRYKKKLSEVIEIVKSKRPVVRPNHGFMAQLKLYDLMGCELNREDPRYKQFRLRMAGDSLRTVKILPQCFADLVKTDPGATSERPDPRVYRCRKCRRILATYNNVIPHIPRPLRVELAKKIVSTDNVKATASNGGISCLDELKNLTMQSPMTRPNDKSELHEDLIETNPEISSDPLCHMVDLETVHQETPAVCRQMFFVEPLAWMDNLHHTTQGKLNCPKCSTKVGSFSWIMGCRCPCGQKVAPAFYLVPSKVEYSDIVQNVLRTV